ncbi:MAG: response regulator [Pseudomonadota bacterium]
MTHLLVIDDSRDDRELLDLLVLDLPGYTVTSAATGPEGLEHLAALPIECILLDYRLDGEDGLDVLASCKVAAPNCPVIMLTGQGNEATAVAAITRGAADYLVKAGLTSAELGKAVDQAQSRARLEQTVAEQADMLKRTDRLDALGQLAAGIAHDFNNILATIRYATDLVLREELSGAAAGYLATARHAIDRGAALSGRLLSFASQTSGAFAARDTGSVLASVEELAGPALGDTIALIVANEVGDFAVTCDQAQLDTSLLNLVLNARDAIGQARSGRIEVTATLAAPADGGDGTAVSITVSDNGPGMSEDVRLRCTDPFFTTKRDAAGAGLGLAIVFGFVQQSGGALRIASTEGAGTSIEMILPAEPATAVRETMPSRRVPAGRRRILVVESDAEQLVMLEAILLGVGYAVRGARSANDAVGIIRSGEPVDLALTDIQLGDGNGFEVARDIRRMRHGLPVIYMSGYGRHATEDADEPAGPILQKPVDPDTLISVIEEQFDPPAG